MCRKKLTNWIILHIKKIRNTLVIILKYVGVKQINKNNYVILKIDRFVERYKILK